MMSTNPLLHAITVFAFALHIGGGTMGLASGTIAIFAPKGGRLHRIAGTVFFVSMLVMAALAAYLAVVMPGQIVNLFIAAFASYLVVTAWITIQRLDGKIGFAEKIGLAIAVLLLTPFAILVVQVTAGLPLFFKTAIPIQGPVLIALYGFTAVLAIAALSDAKVVLAGGISGAPRIARHLWRMCLGLTMAAGSAFTNGLPRLLPGPMHVTPIFFLPQFVPLVLLVFWMIRVRFTGWFRNGPTAHTATVAT
ncbi:MAG TPA: hypothetical protein VGG69_07960 [Rhizomicrobium sp.]|jgi:hypothetical protein